MISFYRVAMITSQISLTSYTRRNRRDVMRLVQDNYRMHVHLDWSTLDEWLEDPNVALLLAWQGRDLMGALAAAAPVNDATWLQLISIRDDADAHVVLAELWSPLRDQLAGQGIREIGALILRPWLNEYTSDLGLTYREDVVTLRRTGGHIPPPLRDDLLVRHGDIRDLDNALALDHAAFQPLWQMSRASMRQAIRLSANFTLAYLNDQAVGYQITSLYHDGAHLARLATLPALQGQGIGGLLIGRMLENFARRGINTVTVNTQRSNQASQRVYQRYGFNYSGLDMPVWSAKLRSP